MDEFGLIVMGAGLLFLVGFAVPWPLTLFVLGCYVTAISMELQFDELKKDFREMQKLQNTPQPQVESKPQNKPDPQPEPKPRPEPTPQNPSKPAGDQGFKLRTRAFNNVDLGALFETVKNYGEDRLIAMGLEHLNLLAQPGEMLGPERTLPESWVRFINMVEEFTSERSDQVSNDKHADFRSQIPPHIVEQVTAQVGHAWA